MSTLFDITDFVIYKGNGVKGLSDMGLTHVPDQFIQPIEERMSNIKIMPHQSMMTIPIIDMSNWEDPKVGDAICDSAEKWGFFQIVNHGVPLQVLEDVKEATYRFFGLPTKEKMKYSKEKSMSKNVRYGSSFNPQTEKALEWKDYLSSLFYVSHHEAASTWPLSCRDEVLEYMKRTEPVIKRLLQVLIKRLNIKEIDETKESLLMGSKRINLNYYPICPNPDLTVGVGRHSDVSTLTVLLQDETGGLYVRPDNGNDEECWINLEPVPGSLVINMGDAMQIMSNGRYKSVEHRVIANGSKARVSVPIFANPRPLDIIGPLPEVLASGEKAIYKDVLYSDYVKHFYKNAHDGKKTLEFVEV